MAHWIVTLEMTTQFTEYTVQFLWPIKWQVKNRSNKKEPLKHKRPLLGSLFTRLVWGVLVSQPLMLSPLSPLSSSFSPPPPSPPPYTQLTFAYIQEWDLFSPRLLVSGFTSLLGLRNWCIAMAFKKNTVEEWASVRVNKSRKNFSNGQSFRRTRLHPSWTACCFISA